MLIIFYKILSKSRLLFCFRSSFFFCFFLPSSNSLQLPVNMVGLEPKDKKHPDHALESDGDDPDSLDAITALVAEGT